MNKEIYVTSGRFTVEDVLPHFTPYQCKKEFNGLPVKMKSIRYHTFQRSVSCSRCGLKGSHFLLQQHKVIHEAGSAAFYHFNLYGVRNGREVMMTKDHIIPKAVIKGFERKPCNFNESWNMTTMCQECNEAKGDDTAIPRMLVPMMLFLLRLLRGGMIGKMKLFTPRWQRKYWSKPPKFNKNGTKKRC